MSAERKLRVLIVGASIAGPAAAYWFAKAGAQVTVIERFPKLRTNGQNVDIRSVGVTVMRKIPGMEAAVRAKAVPMTGISFVDTHDRPFATIHATGNPDQQSLVSEYEILRGDLSKILFDLTDPNPNITYIFDEQISSLSTPANPNDPITVTFTNHHLPPQPFDLIIAADGASSRTRALGLNCPVDAYTHPLHAWAAYFSIPHSLLPTSAPTTGRAYNLPGGRFIALAPSAQPNTSQVTILRTHPRNNNNDPSNMHPFRTAQTTGTDALRTFIAQQFPTATSGWKCNTILTAMQHIPADEFYASEMVQVKIAPAGKLSQGRVVLVGDAGYAAGPTGGGTSLALAGAYVLAGEVGRYMRGEGGLEGALRRYEVVMRPVVEELQTLPRFAQGVFAPQTRWGLWVRNAVLWFVCWSGLLGFGQRWFASAFGEREEGRLPEYEWVA
ncbi:uncharacterized protein B0H64DRAFT_411076 [Chaetomium fimeti]|uniref:FAD-binding domain-containing protein n=1 Tax=Chaetomium fimeti TaxID=1854472 RepID=A0AAE0H6P2_9PEZI|nr:hypothetical protein B0H64DRAFT_411076 [Chaetomium fimeti]